MAKLRIKGYKIIENGKRVLIKRCWSAPGQNATAAIFNPEDGTWIKTKKPTIPNYVIRQVEQAYA